MAHLSTRLWHVGNLLCHRQPWAFNLLITLAFFPNIFLFQPFYFSKYEKYPEFYIIFFFKCGHGHMATFFPNTEFEKFI